MGGVDRYDENISLNRISIRGKSGTFHSLPNVQIQAYTTHGNSTDFVKGDLDLITFGRQVATALLQQNAKVPAGIGTERPASIRYDNMDHLVVPQDKQTRCRMC